MTDQPMDCGSIASQVESLVRRAMDDGASQVSVPLPLARALFRAMESGSHAETTWAEGQLRNSLTWIADMLGLEGSFDLGYDVPRAVQRRLGLPDVPVRDVSAEPRNTECRSVADAHRDLASELRGAFDHAHFVQPWRDGEAKKAAWDRLRQAVHQAAALIGAEPDPEAMSIDTPAREYLAALHRNRKNTEQESKGPDLLAMANIAALAESLDEALDGWDVDGEEIARDRLATARALLAKNMEEKSNG